MNLLGKFNLVCASVFGIGLLASGAASYFVLQRNARLEVTRQADLMMETALAARAYTNAKVKPLIEDRMDSVFLPQSVPSFAAVSSLKYLNKSYPDFSYREATLNPTNPRDKAKGYEVNVVNAFRKDPKQDRLTGIRETNKGRFLYLGRPIRITDKTCLACHSTPEIAPASMLRKYGRKNGFGWKHNEIVGAQIVSVPMALPTQMANQTFRTLMLSLLVAFALVLGAMNLLLRRLVLVPVSKLSRAADDISMGRTEGADLEAKGNDEIAVLTGSFNRMQRSLQQALKLLER
jgi:protein-histidine pros-kinase